jgi:hypothetical protein
MTRSKLLNIFHKTIKKIKLIIIYIDEFKKIITRNYTTSYKNKSLYKREVYKADITYVIIVSLGILSYNIIAN